MQTKVIRIGTVGVALRYVYVNVDRDIDGSERELYDDLCRRARLEYSRVTYECVSAIASLAAGDQEALITGATMTDEWDKQLDFTQPNLPLSESAFVALAGDGDHAVKGAIATQVATALAGHLSDSDATLRYYTMVPEAIAAVRRGQANAVLVDWKMASESTAEHQGQLALIGPAVKLGGGPGIGVRQGDEQLKVKLNKTIGTVHIDGSLKALTTKYSRSHTYTLQMMTRQNLTVEPEAHMQNESICRDLELRNRVVDFITQPDSTLKRPPQTPALLATSTY